MHRKQSERQPAEIRAETYFKGPVTGEQLIAGFKSVFKKAYQEESEHAGEYDVFSLKPWGIKLIGITTSRERQERIIPTQYYSGVELGDMPGTQSRTKFDAFERVAEIKQALESAAYCMTAVGNESHCIA